ncbi:MAG: hypothetical protein ACRYGI_13015 [Janthinobacterium lividum]
MTGTLTSILSVELDRPAPAAVQTLVDEIRRTSGPIAAILFYGSCRRTDDPSGLFDLYVLHDGHRRFHRRAVPAILNRLLPPNIVLVRTVSGQHDVRAKVAILSRRQFARRMRPASIDTTLWARFCQPVSLVHVADAPTRLWVEATLADAARTAAAWAVRFGPDRGTPAEFWQALFARTYGAELRPERSNRGGLIYETNAGWFDRVLIHALGDLGLNALRDSDGTLCPGMKRPHGLDLDWAFRRVLGRSLNLLRLIKAAFTFENGADYIVWKIGRHTGLTLDLSPWQRRHPLLAAPRLLWRMRRRTGSVGGSI